MVGGAESGAVEGEREVAKSSFARLHQLLGRPGNFDRNASGWHEGEEAVDEGPELGNVVRAAMELLVTKAGNCEGIR